MRPIKDSSCRNCVAPKRYPGCHSHCADYIIAKAFHEAERAEWNLEQSIWDYSNGAARKNRDNTAKRRKAFRGYNKYSGD